MRSAAKRRKLGERIGQKKKKRKKMMTVMGEAASERVSVLNECSAVNKE